MDLLLFYLSLFQKKRIYYFAPEAPILRDVQERIALFIEDGSTPHLASPLSSLSSCPVRGSGWVFFLKEWPINFEKPFCEKSIAQK